MTHTANNYPVPIIVQELPPVANLSIFDLNFNQISQYLADIYNVSAGSGGASIVVSDSPPTTSLTNGSLWWDSVHGILKIYYTDADSNQWIDASRSGAGGISNATIDLNFPASPTYNQTYTSDSGDSWVWDGVSWNSLSVVPAQGTTGIQGASYYTTISSSPPSPANIGDTWWDSNTGVRYVYYFDGDSYQWVQESLGVAIQGANGSGAQGTVGTQGTVGVGIQGLAGAQGTIGTQGTIGAGIQGLTGTQGLTGVPGSSSSTIITKVKTTDTSKISVNLADKINDPHLTCTITSGGYYRIELFLRPYGSGFNWAFHFLPSGAPYNAVGSGRIWVNTIIGGVSGDSSLTSSNGLVITNLLTSSDIVKIEGTLFLAEGVFTLYWGNGNIAGISTILEEYSYMVLTKL